MTKRVDWERNALVRKARYGLSIKAEAEYIEGDRASRWLKKAEARPAARAPTAHEVRHAPLSSAAPTGKQPKKQARNFAELNPRDPHDQLAGVDMSRPPW